MHFLTGLNLGMLVVNKCKPVYHIQDCWKNSGNIPTVGTVGTVEIGNVLCVSLELN